MYDFLDVIVRYVPGYGYLPMISLDGKEKFRGSFYKTQGEAYKVACEYRDKVV